MNRLLCRGHQERQATHQERDRCECHNQVQRARPMAPDPQFGDGTRWHAPIRQPKRSATPAACGISGDGLLPTTAAAIDGVGSQKLPALRRHESPER